MAWLHRLARLGDLSGVAKAVAAGDDPNSVTPDGWTPLLLAAREGHVEVVESLLRAGAHLHVAHPNGRSALHFTCRNGHAEVARRLVACGMPVDSKTRFGVTPLIEAARGNHPVLVEALIELGANPETRDSRGRTAAEWLAVGGDVGEAEKRFLESQPELIDGLRRAGPALEQMVRQKMLEEPDADRFAAIHGRNVWCCSYGNLHFDDPTVHEWAHRLAAILAGRALLTQCEERYLSGEELLEARRFRQRRERRALRGVKKNLESIEAEQADRLTGGTG